MRTDSVAFEFGEIQVLVPTATVAAKLFEKFSETRAPQSIVRIGDELLGGIYAGIARGFDGAPDKNLILLPGEFRGTWVAAQEWAAEQGDGLPTRREAALLYANLHDQFKTDSAYWTSESHADGSGSAWTQWFDDGFQDDYRKSNVFHARAVRRV